MKKIYFSTYIFLIILSYFFWDRSLADYLHSTVSPLISNIAHLITFLGDGLLYAILLPLLALFFYFIQKNKPATYRVIFIGAVALVSGLIADILKPILGRSRPELWFDQHLYGFHFFHTDAVYYSFPSGHATTIASVMVALALLFPRYRYYCLAVIALVASTRLILSAHFLSDVMGGVLLGTAVSVWLYRWWIKTQSTLPLAPRKNHD